MAGGRGHGGPPKKVDDAKLRLAILESALDCIISIDQDGAIVEWNPAAERIFGYSREQALGQTMAALIVPPSLREAHAEGLRRYVSSGSARVLGKRIEITGMRSDGTEFPIELAITLDELDGKSIFTAYVRDIADRREAQAQLAEARDKAVEASRLKSQFLATISHELRTPLNGILGMAAVLLDSELDDAQRSYTRAIQESGNALNSIIADLLDFSEVEQGKVVLSPSEFDLHNLVEATTSGFAERAQHKGLDVACDIGERVPRIVCGDGARVAQVLGCLLDNSIKFTATGEILVRAYLAAADGDKLRVRLEVIDTGSGIDSDQLALLFQPFVQGDGSASRRYGGTGLGLSICRELLDLMGGEIEVESELGVGTTVSCSIPLDTAEDDAPASGAEVPCRSVLVVDASHSTREILKSYFSSWGIEAGVAEDGTSAFRELEALEAAGKSAEVVLIASHLVQESGLDIAQLINDSERFGGVPLVLLTNTSDACPIEKAARAGVGRLISKPVSRSQLFDAITDLSTDMETPVLVEPIGLAALLDDDPAPAAIPIEGPMTCLVVEDNIINQQVLTAMLESMGHAVHMADNGVEAVDAFSPDFFDIIFMDIQMPEMDGYEATRRIRQMESGRTHTPIIAVTANAMKGDRELCIEAGMDDYVPKPVDPAALSVAIERSRGAAAAALSGGKGGPVARRGETIMGATIDLSVLENLRAYQREGQPDIVTRLIDLFLGQAPSHVEAVETALASGDADSLARAAHALKGASANLGATKMTSLAGDIEVKGRSGDITSARDSVAALLAEYALVETDLAAQRTPLPNQTGV
jgi:two-component system sensor histidine kinase/response regulator